MATAEKPISVALPTKPLGGSDAPAAALMPPTWLDFKSLRRFSPVFADPVPGFSYFTSSKRAAAMVTVPISVVAVIRIGA